MNYYKEHSFEYILNTKNINMKELYDLFLKYAKPKSKLLDVGFGSGRDMLFFSSIGFDVFGIDPEPIFVKEAKEKGLNVECMAISDYFGVEEIYDNIWASASLLHIPKEMLNQAFMICSDLLKVNGIMYCSFKYGDFSGIENGRYYTYLTEELIDDYINDTKLEVLEIKITEDKLNRKNKWLNVILKKSDLIL
ncbi:MAG: class I SAM-dependent methyltransferase [Anaeroplasmataceae bacterium]